MFIAAGSLSPLKGTFFSKGERLCIPSGVPRLLKSVCYYVTTLVVRVRAVDVDDVTLSCSRARHFYFCLSLHRAGL